MKPLTLPLSLLFALPTLLVGAQDVPTSLVPAPRTDAGILARQTECLRRARETDSAPVIFVGDSITQAWEGPGASQWNEHFAPLGALNLGVSGDRTEHVLWRLQEAPLTHLQPRVIVLLIGTNNLGHGSSDGEQTLAGVLRVMAVLREQAPDATLLVQEIFPRGERFNPMRGEINQINQVLRGQAGEHVRVIAPGDQWVRGDGTIPKEIMPDFLHLTPEGYAQWTAALEPAVQAALK